MFKIVPSEVHRSFKGESKGTAQYVRGTKEKEERRCKTNI
jgi:hypothetical protein